MKPSPRHSKCGRSSNVSDISFSAWVLPSGRTTRVYWFSTSQRPSRICCKQHVHRRQDVQRLETRYHHWLSVHLGHEPVRPYPHHGGHVAGPEEPRQPQVGRLQDGLDRRDDRDVVAEDAEVRTPSARARTSVTAVDGAVVSNPTAKKTTWRSGLSTATLSASSGEYTNRTSAPRAFASMRLPFDPGTRIMSPNVVKMMPGLLGQPHRVVHAAHRDHAHRAPGSVHQLDGLRQQMFDAVPVDGVRVTAAHLHELELVAGRELGDRFDQGACGGRVPEFVDELHACNPFLTHAISDELNASISLT